MLVKRIMGLLILLLLCYAQTKAQSPGFILEIIKAGIVKVIKAVDLKIQRLQNETIWLQNAQKVMENTLSKLRLDEIAQWSEKQRELYANYFDELYKVKNWIAMYTRIKRITEIQVAIMGEYKSAWALFRNDKYFTVLQLQQMENKYEMIFSESVKNLEQIRMMMTAYSTQMSDEKRLEIIDDAGDRIENNYSELVNFNSHNKQLRLEVAKSVEEVESLKLYYGIEQ